MKKVEWPVDNAGFYLGIHSSWWSFPGLFPFLPYHHGVF